jgi:glutaredoxin 2
MEDLRNLIEELQKRHEKLSEETDEVYRKLEEAQEKLTLEEMKNISDSIPYYTKKLERLKVFVEMFKDEFRNTSIHYAFEKKEEPYKGDFHEVIQDPIDYLIGEYDCLGMTKFLEIVFEYHSDAVKKFVEDWMEKNMEYTEPYGDKKNLYNPHFSKKK